MDFSTDLTAKLPAAWRHRLIAFMPAPDGNLRAEIESTGLTLNEKVTIERDMRALAEEVSKENSSAKRIVSTYFKKSLGSSSGPNTGAPVPALGQKSIAPFGVKFSRRLLPGVASVIAVASGKGGVGKSTVSSNLAVALAASGKRVGFLDADIYGPSATLMFGVTGPVAVTAERKLMPKIAHNVSVMSMGLLYDANAPAMWRGPMVVKALEQLIYDTQWGDLDFLIVDLPPGTGDVQLTLIEKLPLAAAVIVTTPQDVALIDAKKAFQMFKKLGIPVAGLIENMSMHRCSQCGHEEAVFGSGGVDAFVKESGCEILARLPLAAKIRESADQGEPVVLRDLDFADVFANLAGKISDKIRHSHLALS